MASAANESDSYVPSEDHDDSFDSEEDERPNRWRGPRTTWRNYNSEEIATATALKEIQDRDLSVHLYNAFSLKQRYRRIKEGVALDGPVAGKDVNATTGELVQPDEWLPQRTWTAWPMRADKVPSLQDSRMNDPDEPFTLRKRVREMPSSALEEVISGEILKTARLKFNARPWAKPSASDEEASDGPGEGEDELSEEETVASTSASGRSGSKSRSRSRSRSKSVKHEHASGDETMDVDPKPRVEQDIKPLLKPDVSADDDLSYRLLRPTVRHILTQLDATLKVLHNVQESTLNYQSDSSNSEASDSSRRSSFSRGRISRPRSRTPAADGKKRPRGRPPGPSSRTQSRARSQLREPTPLVTEEEGEAPKKRTGRPKKTYPRLDGETDKEFAIRIARLRKKPLPVFSDDEPEPEPVSDASNLAKQRQRARSTDSGNSPSGDETAGPSSPRPRRRKRKLTNPQISSKTTRASSRASSVSTTASRNSRTRRRRSISRARTGLRDWRDVLGAAALAGFPPAALDRAARRCADLFGQSVGLHTLAEVPALSLHDPRARKMGGTRETVYVPGMAYPPLVDLGMDGEGEGVVGMSAGGERERGGGGEGRQMRILIRTRDKRRGSLGPGATSEDEAGPSSRRSGSRAPVRSRSRSGSVPGSYVCTVKDCPRAADGEGFARRTNLIRHLKLVHGWTATASATSGEGGEETMEEVDSEDEMYGAVHVDGFLKPIRMRPGWRAADSGERSRSRSRKGGYRTGVTKGKGKRKGRSKGRGDSEVDDGDDDGDVRMSESG